MDVMSLGFNVDEEEGVNTNSTLNKTSEPNLKAFWKRIFQLQLNPENYLNIREINEFNNGLLNTNLSSNHYSFGHMTQPLGILTIDTDGNFSSFSPELLGMKSEKYKDFNFGNVITDSFSSIKTNKNFNLVFDEILRGIKKCNDTCSYFSFCGGGAPSNKLYENGTFDSSETNFCKYTKKILVDTFLEEVEEQLGIA